jgi:hypothetical protein
MNILQKLASKLDDNETKYVNEYLTHGNKLKAYELAFPNDIDASKSVYMYHKRVSVSNYIKEVQRMASEKAILDKAWVLSRLKENSDKGTNGMKTENGIKYDLSSSNRASELIGKDLGMFTNEININGIDELVKGLAEKADLLASTMDEDESE